MSIVSVKKESSIPKYKQIVTSIEKAIVTGVLKKGDILPSLNSIKTQHSLSRDTVLMAFNELKNRGVVQSIVGKGYYVLSENIAITQKVFLMFDELNSFKEDLYNSFLNSLGANIQVDIFFHHLNKKVFSNLITENVGSYSHYVIMPSILTNVKQVIQKLPKEDVYILDQTNEYLSKYASIFQNFKKDMYDGLTEGKSLLKKYKKLTLVFPSKRQPKGLREGFISFCDTNGFEYEIITSLKDKQLEKGNGYMVLDDRNLIIIIKKIKETSLQLAKDVGVISYNDTLLKEIVEGGITTISTDFKGMGKRLAEMIVNNEHLQIENPSRLIIRKSL